MKGDRITIRRLKATCVIGCNPEERERPQDVFITASLETDCSAAGLSDSLEDTVDYFSLSEELRSVAAGARCRLLEALAEKLARACLARPGVAAVEIIVQKPGAIPWAECAEVTLHRP